MAPAREYPYKNVTIHKDRIKDIDALRKQFGEIPTRPECLGLVLDFVMEREKEFLRFAEKKQEEEG